jgi:hypothetical protein
MPAPPPRRTEHEQALSDAREDLGDEAFTMAWAEGRAMTLERAVAYALDEQPAS